MRTTDFDRIATSAPLDRAASVVRDGSGEGVSQRKEAFNAVESDVPLPMKPFHGPDVNLTGRVVGRLTVRGVYAINDGAGKRRWACRCACSNWVVRQTKALKNPANVDDGCRDCRHVDFLRRRSSQMHAGLFRKDEPARLDAIAAAAKSA